MKNLFKPNKLNKKGAGLASVILVSSMVMILASIVLSITFINYNMKVTNYKSSKSFYSAETALDEISIGLQNYIVSPALSKAYLTVMEEYSYLSADEKNSELARIYYEEIWNKLATDKPNNKHYNLAVLAGYVSQVWNDAEGHGTLVTSEKNEMITYEKEGIILKGIEVYYRDEDGFTTTVNTDIKLVCPAMQFGSLSSLPDVMDYSIIADEKLQLGYSTGNETVKLRGNVYSGQISVGSDSVLNVIADLAIKGTIVSKNDLTLDHAQLNTSDDTTLWTKSLVLKSSGTDLKGVNYFSNDINLSGIDSVFKASGRLVAYGNSVVDSNKSSAILVNGKDSTIDLTGIENMTIAGHAFVGSKDVNYGTVSEAGDMAGGVAGKGNDVFTGESVMVKSDQIMYLVPAECIGVSYTVNGGVVSYGKSVYNSNPLTAEQYNEIITNSSIYEEIVTDKTVASLGHNLAYYIASVGATPSVEKVFARSNTGKTMVYYYMTFANESLANQYFRDYYALNKSKVDNYMDFYAKSIKIPDAANMVRLQTAANLVKYDGDTNNGTLVNNTVDDAYSTLTSSAILYESQMSAFCTKLLNGYTDTSEAKYHDILNNNLVFENIVLSDDTEALKQYVAANGSGSPKYVPFPSDESGKSCYALVIDNPNAADTYVYNDSQKTIYNNKLHLIIATGNVDVETDFKGLIFANGQVRVKEGVTVLADVDAVTEAFSLERSDGTAVYSLMRDGAGLLSAGGSNQFTSMNLQDLVKYENWTKR